MFKPGFMAVYFLTVNTGNRFTPNRVNEKMKSQISSGGCYCGNVTLELTTTAQSSEIEPRACDCDFCVKHGASYVSDPAGSLKIKIRDSSQTNYYKQGAELAEFIVCKNCGVLPAVFAEIGGRVYGVVNSRCLDQSPEFKEAVVVSPKKLSPDDKKPRWQQLWIPDVEIQS